MIRNVESINDLMAATIITRVVICGKIRGEKKETLKCEHNCFLETLCQRLFHFPTVRNTQVV